MRVQQQYYSLSDAGKYMGRSKRWIEAKTTSGELPRKWLGASLVVTRDDLDALVKTEENKSRRFE